MCARALFFVVLCTCACACVRACVRACVCVLCVRACVFGCVLVRVCGRGGGDVSVSQNIVPSVLNPFSLQPSSSSLNATRQRTKHGVSLAGAETQNRFMRNPSAGVPSEDSSVSEAAASAVCVWCLTLSYSVSLTSSSRPESPSGSSQQLFES